MQWVILLAVVTGATCRFGSGGSPTGPHQPEILLKYPLCEPSLLFDVNRTGQMYHYSWCHDNDKKYSNVGAKLYCAGLGPGWQALSIDVSGENEFVNGIIESHKVDSIWTTGSKTAQGWTWGSGNAFHPLNWSTTGADGVPQPDNREAGGENCLAVLNNAFQDGIKWHDVACHQLRPTICEKDSIRFP